MAAESIYLRVASAPIAPNTIGAISASTYSQELTFNFSTTLNAYNCYFFGLFQGNTNPVKYKFPIESNIIIKSLRLSIPNLPGARFAINPNGAIQLVQQGYNIGIGGYDNGGALTGTNFYPVSVNQLGVWTPQNIIVNIASILNPTNTTTYYQLAFGSIPNVIQKIYVDFRNYQTEFDAINIYLLAELEVIAPSGMDL